MVAKTSSLDATSERAKQHFQVLRSPMPPQILTEHQKQKRKERERGRQLWEEVMEDVRLRRKRLLLQPTGVQPNGKSFLDLPPELRNVIYKFYREEDQLVQGGLGQSLNNWVYYNGLPMISTAPQPYTGIQEKRRRSDRRLVDKVSQSTLDQATAAYDLSPNAHEAFLEYKSQHDLRLPRCFHEEHSGPFPIINQRGNLCGDLPSIALTCREVLDEVWGYTHASNSFRINIRNMGFFPSLRFFQTLQRCNALNVTGKMIDAQFWEVVPSEKDSVISQDRYARKFQNVQRLIEMHWLDDLPLWGCFTGFYGEVEDSDAARYDEEYKGCIASRNLLSERLYAVRQIVALYRFNVAMCRYLTIKYLKAYDILDDVSTLTPWVQRSDADIIEAIIDVISKGIEYLLGHQGNFETTYYDSQEQEYERGKYAYFQLQGDFEMIACEKEHAIVNLVNRYSIQVDRLLREELGQFYGEWEEMEDERTIPNGLLF
jgi:hypothetical protein